MSELRPTHHCFDDALDYLEHLCKTQPRAHVEEHYLVHGILLTPTAEQARFAHAWVEHGDTVINSGLLDGELVYAVLPRGRFYSEMHVQDVTRYTVAEAVEENWRSGHYGPWKAEYAALCGANKQIHGAVHFAPDEPPASLREG